MGWKSTMGITREDVMQKILERLDQASDETLVVVLEDLVDGEGPTGTGLYGHNFSIVPEYPKQGEEQGQGPSFYLR